MKRQTQWTPVNELEFRSKTESGLTLHKVFERIVRFMKLTPCARYKLMIGTDCQVHPGHTKFITGVVIQRMGAGAWACYRQVVWPRTVVSIQEKLSAETDYSEEIALFFDRQRRSKLEEIVLPFRYEGAALELFIHIDAGSDTLRNRTAAFVEEMAGRVESLGMVPVIKPDAYVASAYANRHSKKPFTGVFAARKLEQRPL
ncbi:ribonuclease H-like YkuK family protein [Paenibacillus athensensis]|uniref:DUF458 domain-containing protein n=1 Tax=Paenibacillus athensensis TaxID=1967502 RepID=A0A4Y8QBE9_9BACL|nr:ribonuclease H-like YkuK family protein [Paenibacillus athensensis]MCD1257724.1 ribonuclease H-like YkuK family protein [Paenibacillus athensensis]